MSNIRSGSTTQFDPDADTASDSIKLRPGDTVPYTYHNEPCRDDKLASDRKGRIGNNRYHQSKATAQRKRKLAAASRRRNRK